MNKQLIVYASFMLMGTFISSATQVLLKKAAEEKHKSFIREYLNPKVIIAYAVIFGAIFLSIFAYRVVPLSMGAILEATGYIYVTIFGVTIFKERISGLKVLALILIISGIAVYALLG